MYSIDSTIFDLHHQFVKQCEDAITSSDVSNFQKILAQNYLDSLASKSGNDVLEKLLVEASGRKVKSVGTKHGADSEDGLLEAKPMKTSYNAHISDDTPMSLMRHQEIPLIILGEASSDGKQVLWALLMDYRMFDQDRLNKMNYDKTLEIDPILRFLIINDIVKKHPKKTYIRSNPLPFNVISKLQSGEYSLWVNPNLKKNKNSPMHTEILKLSSTSSTLSSETMKNSFAIRDYFLSKKSSS
jgi:hypothetical protein